MRIGIIYHKFMRAGGQERYLFNVVREFLRQQHEVHIIAARRGDDDLPVHFHPVSIINNPHSLRMLTFARNSKKVAQTLDLDVTYGLGKTYFQDVHRSGGGLHRVYLEQSSRLGRRFWSPKDMASLRLDERLYHGGETKWFVANSEFIKGQILKNYRVEPGKISVVYTGVDQERFNPDIAGRTRAATRAKLGLGETERVFLFVSFDHPRKGLETLLRAFGQTKGRLIVVGRSLNSSYKNLVAELGLQDRVMDAGPQEDVVAWYGLADFMVLPSFYDPLPNVVLESLACGTPVIVSAQTGAAERIEEGRDGFVLQRAGDIAGLQAIFEKISSLDDSELRQMRDTAAAKGGQFSLSQHVRDLLSLFDKVRGVA